MTDQQGSRGSIKPKLGLFDSTMIVVSLIIGAGIFRTPSEVALEAGSTAMFFAAWLIGGLIAVMGALTFAEIGARRPVAGGFYELVSHSYGMPAAFMLNWIMVVVSGVNGAAITLVGVDYVYPYVVPAAWHGAFDDRMASALLILILYGINLTGIKTGARVQNVLSIAKIVLILAVALFAFASVGAPAQVGGTAPARTVGGVWLALGAALVPVFFTYGGYQMTMNVGADVQNPKRNIPLAILIGVAVVVTLYMLINYAYFQVLGLQGIATSKKVAGDLAGRVFGPWGDALVSFSIFLSLVGFMNVTLIHMPRAYLAMARDGVLPPLFGRVNQRTQVQVFGLSFFVATILVSFWFLGEFGRMLNFVMFIDILAMAVLATTIFALRRRDRDVRGYQGYKVPLYPLLPGAYVVFLLLVVAGVFINDVFVDRRYYTLVSLGIMAAGYPLSVVCRRFYNETQPTL
jgi:APA family basic amino acid/polyamine antiporter